MNYKKLIISLLFVAGFFTFIAYDTYAKNENAPGQLKKEENQSNNPSTSNQDGPKNNQSNSSSDSQNKKENPGKKIGLAESPPKNKLGSEKIKNIISKLNTQGDGSTAGKLKAKKVKVSEASPAAQLKRHAVFGIITALGDGTITLVHQIQRERTYQVLVDDLTEYKIKGITDATFADLTLGLRIAAVGTPTSDGLLAKRIHVVPGKAVGVFSKQPIATPSGSLTTTPVATTSPTLTITSTPTPTPTLEPSATPTP
ncbi:hypothetical protein HY407_04150 [Candidatus Gottesmanbacteria bacterium]|nr:hypothetical protein [Candidatus Gottesmanbacteria bacterium]